MFRSFLNKLKYFANRGFVHGLDKRFVLSLPSNVRRVIVIGGASTTIWCTLPVSYSEAPSDKLKPQEVASHVAKGVLETREKLKKAGKEIPPVKVSPMMFEDGGEGQWVEFHFDPQCNIVGLVEHLLAILYPKSRNESRLKRINEFFASPKAQLIIDADEGKSSIVLQKYVASVKGSNKKRVELSIELFKYGGLTKADAEELVRGYNEAFSPENAAKKPVFNLDTSPGSKGTQTYDDSAERTDPAIDKLQRLGVEVFDKKSNALLTWDSLAGYESVKRLIQDTIVNALQYPEIYDRVAAQTRVVFESNRPKAVLFEGPPGTGKTLTARILASQCDRPLVVIRLDSILSKWYGESEKKFGQILDACDDLDGAIVFVDEIDSLAPSRDAEEGIHEASKRVLSILLQRVEGFHGKGKSVLVCATNRKQDLDAALISRFDLMIQYPLPDFHTRGEIFKRYAKQFSVLAGEYAVLSRATEGFSCRGIKEVCEQAERMCASRLVAQHVQREKNKEKKSTSFWGSSSSSSNGSTANEPEVPVLNDYLECIEMHRRANDIKVGVSSAA